MLKKYVLKAALAAINAHASEVDKKFYIAGEYGAFRPLSKKFKIDDVKVKAQTNSGVVGARIGYQFHPDMFLDFSWTRRDNVKMSAALDKGLPPLVKLAWGSAKIKYESYILSVKYMMPKEDSKFTPYLGAGLGIAKIGVRKQDTVSVNIPPFNFNGITLAHNGPSGRVLKGSKTTPAVRLFGGVDAEITKSFSIYLDGRVEVTKKVPIRFEIDNPFTQGIDQTKKLKTRMGVSEAVIGLKFSF